MNYLYVSEISAGLIGVILAIVIAGMAGFAIGHLVGHRERKCDESFNPRLRPDHYHEDTPDSTTRKI